MSICDFGGFRSQNLTSDLYVQIRFCTYKICAGKLVLAFCSKVLYNYFKQFKFNLALCKAQIKKLMVALSESNITFKNNTCLSKKNALQMSPHLQSC